MHSIHTEASKLVNTDDRDVTEDISGSGRTDTNLWHASSCVLIKYLWLSNVSVRTWVSKSPLRTIHDLSNLIQCILNFLCSNLYSPVTILDEPLRGKLESTINSNDSCLCQGALDHNTTGEPVGIRITWNNYHFNSIFSDKITQPRASLPVPSC